MEAYFYGVGLLTGAIIAAVAPAFVGLAEGAVVAILAGFGIGLMIYGFVRG